MALTPSRGARAKLYRALAKLDAGETFAVAVAVLSSIFLRPGDRAIASRDLHSKHSSPIVFIESGLEPLVLYADLGGFVSAQ
jgi:hypothetical protein